MVSNIKRTDPSVDQSIIFDSTKKVTPTLDDQSKKNSIKPIVTNEAAFADSSKARQALKEIDPKDSDLGEVISDVKGFFNDAIKSVKSLLGGETNDFKGNDKKPEILDVVQDPAKTISNNSDLIALAKSQQGTTTPIAIDTQDLANTEDVSTKIESGKKFETPKLTKDPFKSTEFEKVPDFITQNDPTKQQDPLKDKIDPTKVNDKIQVDPKIG